MKIYFDGKTLLDQQFGDAIHSVLNAKQCSSVVKKDAARICFAILPLITINQKKRWEILKTYVQKDQNEKYKTRIDENGQKCFDLAGKDDEYIKKLETQLYNLKYEIELDFLINAHSGIFGKIEDITIKNMSFLLPIDVAIAKAIEPNNVVSLKNLN